VNDKFARMRGRPQLITVPRGPVRLRLHLANCQDWDSTVTARGGELVDTIGLRNPRCFR
jgi:hypothetical protein